uniref:Solute-binding protein family 3/N-terminal domain-containing protein n=1 Tax=Corethron hystrix TaxID=216773 RepID=A0A7S1G2G0_9STRA|mmetsp:Transcript_8946/g.19765  ORF Transcript_8946/g.19765 Transcript_8946/m.19765 type:complete len:255 (+) Transcript_8946:230-994(+)|eukprot:CAMPEP_0113300724 /NCGR_PEP_ID=MMETSP0010_2-20120614/2232_1 /TAXON_ID=216773 ORGANISM="Corethron hystrix, Strain 308" /NCGR_SAMPLE_ID=MMETSP0010_2 /ASSEMBLY_ACC=CAM_ASM_000155 /LENGTH=254 /DNA_ID=CAMNT_0000154191 /DNA_START=211 /DNA_END=975 /DNA_ORIENTATION=+ /assembly_acc=CAM_ASM_000155
MQLFAKAPAAIVRALAPSGVLRAGINLSNILLVTGEDPSGQPQGISPEMARTLAASLDVPLQMVPYANPGLLADAALKDEWDVGLIGAETKRAQTICFTPPYAEIQATYLTRAGSSLQTVDDVDREGIRIAVSRRSAYELWLTENIRYAEIVRTEEPGLEQSKTLFEQTRCDVLAGLRPWLTDKLEAGVFEQDCRLLEGSFTSVQQAIGTPRNRDVGEATLWLEQFVAYAKSSGLVAELIERHKVTGRLSVAMR